MERLRRADAADDAGWLDRRRSLGCRDLASDAHADNTAGILTHPAVGFEETERVVFFRKPL